LIEIRPLFAIKLQHISRIQTAALQPVSKSLLAIFVIVDADNIVALPQLDHDGPTKAFYVQHIVDGVIGRRCRFIAHINPGQSGVCTGDMQFVVGVAGLKDKRLKAGILDTDCHTQTDDFILGQTVSAIGRSVAVIADPQDIIAFAHTAGLGPTVNRQKPEQDVVNGKFTIRCRRNRFADGYRVNTRTGFDKGRPVHRP